MLRVLLLSAVLFMSWFPSGTSSVLPQKKKAADQCPWCENDPETLAKIGAVSHGPFSFARKTTDDFRDSFPASGWVFLETDHLRLATNLGPTKLSVKERKRIAADLDRLREVFPDLPKKPKKLDPWLRMHLLAMKCEDFYARFQAVLQVDDDDFTESRDFDGPFMGDGKFLGEKEKFELIWHKTRKTHQLYTRDLMGGSVTDALRWHLSPEHKLIASIPAEDGDLSQDVWLYPHTVHLMSHLFLCAYKHFSYDPPIWLDEGLAHVMEREVNPLSTTIDGDEGSGPHRGGHQDWSGMDAKLAKKTKIPSLAEMMRWNAFHDLDETAHRTAWSKVRFLVNEHPDKFARFVGGIKGQLDDKGYPSGKDLVGLQRRLLKEIWGWSPAQLDGAWNIWAREQK